MKLEERLGKKSKEHISIAHRHRQQCRDGQREVGWGSLQLSNGGMGNGEICNNVNNKNKKLKHKNKNNEQKKSRMKYRETKVEVGGGEGV